MAITNNPKLEYESGQSLQDFEQMSDTGDGTTFEASFAPWSGRSGFEASVLPFGLATGGDITPNTGSDSVAVAALTAYMPGAAAADANGLASVASGTVGVNRALSDTHIINSITVDAAGSLAAVQGSEGTAFSETRGAAGGPPLIPVDSVEIGQVRLATTSAAPVKASEIFQVVGTHTERYDSPVWTEDPTIGEVTFASPLPAIHTGDVPKQVHVRGYTPIFAELPRVSDFVPADESNTVNSTQIYGSTLGSVSSSLGQASFTCYGQDGITDPIIKVKGERLWFRWHQDRNRAPFSLTQGIVGVSRSYPAGDHVNIPVTISAEQPTEDFDG
ncbi:hypothetical protein [Halomonas salina]|uniref:Minor tail protein n=1 Tax=Halomonas salina TaxID=42565 RepID=A0ABR4WU65_9GAMM|nr:hypothetical protein [Halomonas salina]KGE78273.1 hypothetical protein FP66_04570 [Halomonas salina]